MSIYCNGQPAGDLDTQAGPHCRIGIANHLRLTPSWCRRGLARLAVTALLDRHPDHAWTIP